MHKIIYVIRHCQATGQKPEAPLTPAGKGQAQALASFLLDSKIERIVSSPFLRAVQSIEPLACSLDLEIETDERLVERVLSNTPLPDWLTCLRNTFADLDLSFPGGESSRMATQRAVSALHDILNHEQQITALISHGNLSTLIADLTPLDNKTYTINIPLPGGYGYYFSRKKRQIADGDRNQAVNRTASNKHKRPGDRDQ